MYRLLGHEGTPLTFAELEQMVRGGLVDLDTKVSRDGEGFAAALRARAEFQHLLQPGEGESLGPGER